MDSIPIIYNGHIHFNVKIENTINSKFIFDTGWNGITLDSQFCKINAFKPSNKEIKLNGIGNITRTSNLITDTINYVCSENGYQFYTTKTLMFDLKNLVDSNIDGIAGIQTFAQKTYMLDYFNQKIIFTDSVNGFEAINALFENNKIYLPLTITLKNKKKIKGKFLLDTGSDRTILNSHVFKTEGIYNALDLKKFFHKGGIGGDSHGYFLPVKEASLSKFKLKNVTMTVSIDTLGMLADSEYLGILGNDLLDDFHIIFDHQKEKIWVKPNKNFNKNEKKLFRGVSFFDTGDKWIVAGIVEDTEAYQKGIRMNDEIFEINNIPVNKINIDDFVKGLKANDILRLKIKQNNEEKEIEFKLKVFIKA
jgi:hypothetical protein